MDIGLLLIGDELTRGKREDKHFPHMREVLAARGLEVAWVRIVGDDRARLTRHLRETFASGDLVFSFGGIGGTPDDLTRECAAASGRPLARHPEAVVILEERFGREAYPIRIRMAELPQGATLIPNPVNRVPGFSVGDHHFLPGFPDMAWPMAEWVLDTRYRHLFDPQPPVERRLRAEDTPESALVPLMETVLAAWPEVQVSSLPSTGRRGRIELGVRGPRAQAEAAFAAMQSGLDDLGVAWTVLS